MWKKIQTSEVYHCYQLIYTLGNKIKETNQKCIPICLFCFQNTTREIENMNLINFLQVITSSF